MLLRARLLHRALAAATRAEFQLPMNRQRALDRQ